MPLLTGGTFIIAVPGWADGKDGNTGIAIQIINSNGMEVANFRRGQSPPWPIGREQSFSDGIQIKNNIVFDFDIKAITDVKGNIQLEREFLKHTIVKVTKMPNGNDRATFYLGFQFSFDDGSKMQSSSIGDSTQEDVFRMLESGNQTVSKRFIEN